MYQNRLFITVLRFVSGFHSIPFHEILLGKITRKQRQTMTMTMTMLCGMSPGFLARLIKLVISLNVFYVYATTKKSTDLLPLTFLNFNCNYQAENSKDVLTFVFEEFKLKCKFLQTCNNIQIIRANQLFFLRNLLSCN